MGCWKNCNRCVSLLATGTRLCADEEAGAAPLRSEKSRIVPTGTSFRPDVTDVSDDTDVIHIARGGVRVALWCM